MCHAIVLKIALLGMLLFNINVSWFGAKLVESESNIRFVTVHQKPKFNQHLFLLAQELCMGGWLALLEGEKKYSDSVGNTVAYLILHFDIENYEVSFCITLLLLLFCFYLSWFILTYWCHLKWGKKRPCIFRTKSINSELLNSCIFLENFTSFSVSYVHFLDIL